MLMRVLRSINEVLIAWGEYRQALIKKNGHMMYY